MQTLSIFGICIVLVPLISVVVIVVVVVIGVAVSVVLMFFSPPSPPPPSHPQKKMSSSMSAESLKPSANPNCFSNQKGLLELIGIYSNDVSVLNANFRKWALKYHPDKGLSSLTLSSTLC